MEYDQSRQGGQRPDLAPTRQLPASEFADQQVALDNTGYGYGEEQPGGRYRDDRPEPNTARTTVFLAGLVVLVVAAIGLAAYIAIATSGDDEAAPQSIVVPAVIGESQATATNRLIEAGFLVTVEFVENENVEPGTVFAQNPEPGTEHDPTEAVIIFVAAGAETVAVPNVVDRQTEAAQSELEALGFVVTVTEEPSDIVDVGRVIRQSIEPGQLANRGAGITITVSTGPGGLVVPNVVNQSQANAEQILIGAGFVPRIELVDVQPDSGSAGTVVSQTPAPGLEAESGAEVTITVGRGSETTTTSTDTSVSSTVTTAAPSTTAQTTAPAVDLVDRSEEFVLLWADGDWDGMADIASPEAIEVAQEWYEPGGQGDGCLSVQARMCEVVYAPSPGDPGIIFQVTFSPEGKIQELTFVGDAG